MTAPFDDRRQDPPAGAVPVDRHEPEPVTIDVASAEPTTPDDLDLVVPPWADELLTTQAALHEGLERIATAVTPLLTKQFKEIEARNRAYEQRLKLRQERPLIVKMAGLLNDVRRLGSDADIRTHVETTLEAILVDLGYQPFGDVGERYDPMAHDAIAGRMAKDAVVTEVHAAGLACFGDVIVRARVEVGPPPAAGQREPGERETEAQQDGTHAAHRD